VPEDIQNLPGTGKNSAHRVYSNFFSDNYIIQQACMSQPKNLIIDVLRKHFSTDNIYTYRADEYGFPLTRDLTGIDIDSELTTKILISDTYRYEVKFFPAIVVKANGGNYKPISINQEGTLRYRITTVEDVFGVKTEMKIPTHRVYAGAWDLNFDVSIYSESQSELQELVDIVSMIFQYVSWNELRANGIFVKNISIGSENAEPYANDYVFNQTITLPIRTEWRVEIPIENLVEKIVFYFDSVRTPVSPNATVADKLELTFDDVLEFANITL
jgi:hypothetical protein